MFEIKYIIIPALLGTAGSPRRHSSMDEMLGIAATLTLNGQRQRSLSDSGTSSKDSPCANGK